jgi:hypothetical protein
MMFQKLHVFISSAKKFSEVPAQFGVLEIADLNTLLYVRDAQIFQKSMSPQNSRRQMGYIKQVQYRRPTNVRHPCTKCCHLGDLATRTCKS